MNDSSWYCHHSDPDCGCWIRKTEGVHALLCIAEKAKEDGYIYEQGCVWRDCYGPYGEGCWIRHMSQVDMEDPEWVAYSAKRPKCPCEAKDGIIGKVPAGNQGREIDDIRSMCPQRIDEEKS